MTTFLIPVFVFVAVTLIMLLVYVLWVNFFDPRNKAKKERLQTIHNAVHRGGQRLRSAKTFLHETAFEAWLRTHFKTFEQLENLVQRAQSPLTVGRLLGLMLALFLVVVVLGLLLRTNFLVLLMLSGPIAGTPVLWLSRKANKRRQAFENKLPETLDFISRALRAGHSLTGALGEVGKEFPDPIGQEFKIVADEMAFGIPFKDAIGQLADRIRSNDINFFVISLLIQHETGGNLTELFDTLAGTIRERMKLRGKIRTLSSEGRASAWILGGMPFVLAGILTIINPSYMALLWTTPQGKNLILTGGVLMAVGALVLKRIIQIKV